MAQRIETKEQAEELVKKLKIRYQSTDPLEEAKNFVALRVFYTSEALAKELDVSRAYIYQRINVLKNLIPELKRLLQTGELPFSMAYRLSRLSPNEQHERLMPIVAEIEAPKEEV